MPRQPIPFGQKLYQPRSDAVSLERALNMYVEATPNEEGGSVMYGTPGLKNWNSYGSGAVRGLIYMEPKLYAVIGNELHSISSTGASKLIGTVNGSGAVYMTHNGTHIAIPTTSNLYAANDDEILDLAEGNMIGSTYQDGYGIFARRSSEDFYITTVDDMTAISALDVSNADTFPDNLVGLISDHRELWLFGQKTIEVWQNTGNADFPFERSPSGFMERGCISGGSIAKSENMVFWLGDDLRFYQAGGYQPQAISTPGIDSIVEGLGDPTTCNAFVYTQNGHVFYEASFSDKTLVYDLTTGAWHERVSPSEARHRCHGYARAFGKHLVGDFETNKIYELDLNTYTDDGSAIEREIVSPPVSVKGYKLAYSSLVLDMETGVGLTSGDGYQPKVQMTYSDDDGHSWSNELQRSIGEIGQREHQVRWNRLGESRERTYRFRISDAVKPVMIKSYADVEARAV